jgi:hypothetical protein
MSHTEFRAALRLLDSTLALVTKGETARPATLQRRIRALSLQLELMRARMRQPITPLGRN